jgi:O-acetyl-ADP-ribose deacetylase (regulator of RNase III)
MIYTEGNLLDAPHRMIVHGCNSQGVMGSGVARAIRDKWPEVYQQYRQRYQLAGLQLGDVVLAYTDDGKIVANCITQDFYGKDGKHYVNYDAVAVCMNKLKEICERLKITEVAMPLIGAGLGGGDWNILREIIQENLHPIEITVYHIGEVPTEGR